MKLVNFKQLEKEIAEKIINYIEKENKLIWQSNLISKNINGMTKKYYNGLNQFFLTISMLYNNYSYPVWFTFNQVKKLNGQVKKGEHATLVYFYDKYLPKHTKAMCKNCKNKENCQENYLNDKEIYFNENMTIEDICENYKPIRNIIIKAYYVFNIEQTTLNIEKLNLNNYKQVKNFNENLANSLIYGYKHLPEIKQGSNPCYDLKNNIIYMPAKNLFKTNEDYYLTFFHELIHSTRKYLNRKIDTTKKENYSYEELVAEIGACLLGSICNISNYQIKNSSAYIKHWLTVLKNNKQWIIRATQVLAQ